MQLPVIRCLTRPAWIGALLMTCALDASAAAAAGAACGPYRVGYHALGQLYGVDAMGRPQGIDKDVLETLAKRSGCTFVTEVDSRVRIWEAIRNGRLDLTTSVVPTPEREAMGEIVVYKSSRNRLLVRAARADELNSMAAFLAKDGVRVVVVRSFMYSEPFDDWLATLRAQHKLEEVVDYNTAVRVFAAGRVDAMIVHSAAEDDVSRAMAENGGFRAIKVEGAHPFPSGLFISRRTVSATDRQLLRRTLTEMVRDGTVERIIKRHQDRSDTDSRAVPPP